MSLMDYLQSIACFLFDTLEAKTCGSALCCSRQSFCSHLCTLSHTQIKAEEFPDTAEGRRFGKMLVNVRKLSRKRWWAARVSTAKELQLHSSLTCKQDLETLKLEIHRSHASPWQIVVLRLLSFLLFCSDIKQKMWEYIFPPWHILFISHLHLPV